VRRALALVVVAAAAAIAARVAAPSEARPTVHAQVQACGVERWAVKTLQDRPHLLRVRRSTVAHLVSVARPGVLPQARLPFERRVFRVVARVRLVREEGDSDIHVVLQDGGRSLIAEAPDAPVCTPHATALRKRQMSVARRAVRPCARAAVTGVAFFDFFHGQTGVAPNGIELHPILGFTCLSGGAPPPPPPPPGHCAASYPDHCIPPPPPDLDCSDIAWRNFRVLWNVQDPDPHRFDGDRDGIGCET
jgi:hypothetical protein